MIDKFLSFITIHPKKSLIVILALTTAAYSNIFANQFIMDDFDFIADWPLIQSWDNFFRFIVYYVPPDGQPGIYSPLKTIFHAVNYTLFGLNPFGYHVVSLLTHFAGIIAVYHIAHMLTAKRLAGFITALLFGLHPVQAEAITSMTASVDMIGIVFLYVSFFFYLKAVGYGLSTNDQTQMSFNKIQYIQAIIFSILAIFTHELAISLPFLILFYDLCYNQKINQSDWKRSFLRAAPFFAVVGIYVLSKYLVLGGITRGGYLEDSVYLTMLVVLKAWLKYLCLVVWPLTLTLNHIISPGIFSYGVEDFDRFSVLSQNIFDGQVVLAIFILGGVVYMAITQYKKNILLSFCIGWFFLCLLPVSQIIPSGVLFAERYLYPGIFGFCLLIGWLLCFLLEDKNKEFKQKGLVVAGMCLVLMAYGLRTYVRNFDWRNPVVFYQSIVHENPQSSYMKRDLGIVYLQNNQPYQAITALKEAVNLNSGQADIYFPLGSAYRAVGDYQKAKEALQKAIELDPQFAEAYFNLGSVVGVLGERNSADMYFRQAINIYQSQGRYLEALRAQEAIAKIDQVRGAEE